MSEQLHRRLRDLRSRLALRSWEYRQRHHAKGTWCRLRRVLAEASHAFLVSEEAMIALMAEGCRPESVGDELEPRKVIVFASPQQIDAIEGCEEIPVRLGPAFLAARHVALLRFS